MTKQQKITLLSYYPELQGLLEQRERGESNSAADMMLVALINKIQSVKGEKGDMPIKGEDYMTDAEMDAYAQYLIKEATPIILKKATPIKGVHYDDGKDGKDYVLTTTDKDEIARKIKVPVVNRIIETKEIIKEVSKSISIEDIKGAVSKKDLEIEKKTILDGMKLVDGRIKLIDQRWHGGGLSRVSHDSTLSGDGTPSNPLIVIGGGSGGGFSTIVITGTVNNSNVTFTAASQPILLDINGFLYPTIGGAITWTYVAGTITLSEPVGTGGFILGIGGGGSSSGNTFLYNEIVSGSGTSYTLAHTPVINLVTVYARGVRLKLGTAYTISGAVITTTDTWAAGDIISDYQY